jgi:glycosyltransferase involved in cell wall biosynthesis
MQLNIMSVSHGRNFGKGRAIRTGLSKATDDIFHSHLFSRWIIFLCSKLKIAFWRFCRADARSGSARNAS